MGKIIYNPVSEFSGVLKSNFREESSKTFANFVKEGNVDLQKNKETVEEYESKSKELRKAQIIRALYCIALLTTVIAAVVMELTFGQDNKDLAVLLGLLAFIGLISIGVFTIKEWQKVNDLKEEADMLKNEALDQVKPIKDLLLSFNELDIIEKVLPLMQFDKYLSAAQEEYLTSENGLKRQAEYSNITAKEFLSGSYNHNRFLLERDLIHKIEYKEYKGSYEIEFEVETKDSDGNAVIVKEKKNLHASAEKPVPVYSEKTIFHYFQECAPNLSFSREHSNAHLMSSNKLNLFLNYRGMKLKSEASKAIKRGMDFVPIGNSKFECLFNALDRDNELEFRGIFTPVAQSNMTELLLSKDFGDNFNFKKEGPLTEVFLDSIQEKSICPPSYGVSKLISAEEIETVFIDKNEEYFTELYSVFAPVLAIPAYQFNSKQECSEDAAESELHCSERDCEALVNMIVKEVVHPLTKTEAILKTKHIKGESDERCDVIEVMAYSYDAVPDIDYVVTEYDGKSYNVPVEYIDYIPLVKRTKLKIKNRIDAGEDEILASKNNLCIVKEK